MATCELKGELKHRDGRTNQFTVKVEENLKSMITGIKRLNADVSEVLTVLVEREKGSTGNSRADVDVDDEEGDSDEEDDTTKMDTKSNTEPPKKRKKN